LDTPGTNLTQQRGSRNAFALLCNLTKSTDAEKSRFDSRKRQEIFLGKSRPPTTQLILQPQLRMSGDKPTFPHTPSRGTQRLHLPPFYRDTSVVSLHKSNFIKILKYILRILCCMQCAL